MKLVLLGGVKGVGKTTLLSWAEREFAGKIALLNPGELFRRYHYKEKLKTTEEVEELILCALKEMPDDAVAVLHWHYAVRRLEGYIPQISFSRLERLAESKKIDRVMLAFVEAPVSTIFKRRRAEYARKKRALSQRVIHEEIAAERKFLAKHVDLFTEALGDRNVTVVRVQNVDLEEAKRHLGSFLSQLVG